jgi:hypothetical protein
MGRVTDRITLTLAGAPELQGVASLVLGGIGSRLDLPYERVDELQLAVLSVLEAGSEDRPVDVDVAIDDDVVAVVVGPLAERVSSDSALAKILDRLVDGIEETSRDGAVWLTLRLSRPASA